MDRAAREEHVADVRSVAEDNRDLQDPEPTLEDVMEKAQSACSIG